MNKDKNKKLKNSGLTSVLSKRIGIYSREQNKRGIVPAFLNTLKKTKPKDNKIRAVFSTRSPLNPIFSKKVKYITSESQ